jgi:hypothetical protein
MDMEFWLRIWYVPVGTWNTDQVDVEYWLRIGYAFVGIRNTD